MKRPRVALWVYYRGDLFRGYQLQPEGPTVQGELMRAFAEERLPSGPVPAGRTDRGVHARMQVVSFSAPLTLDVDAIPERLNRHLPSGVGVCLARRTGPGFHAQWSATGKEYRYRLDVQPGERRFDYFWRPHEHPDLLGRAIDLRLLAELLEACEGTREFAPFHERSSPRRERTITRATLVERANGAYEVRIVGDRFGRYQIRYLVGGAVAAAMGVLDPSRFRRALEANEPFAGLKAPANGLILWEVHYARDVDPFSADDRMGPATIPNMPPFSVP